MIHDIVVVGAGPAGIRTSELLAGRGHDVVLLDENPAPRTSIVCTGIIGAEAFDKLGLPRGSVVDQVRRAHFLSPSGVRVVHEPQDPVAYVVDRSRFDESLTRRAINAGVSLRRGHAARGVRKSETEIAVEARVGRETREVHARALVVATGHQRWLHEESGLGVPRAYVHGVHADLPFRDLDATELYFGRAIAPGFFAWAAPFGNGKARLGVLSAQGSRQLFSRFLRTESVAERLGNLAGDEPDAGSRLQSRAIVQGFVDPSYSDRVLAVGEAAGQVKTTTGGGIYYGLIGAQIAADVLDAALGADRLDATFLQEYERRWQEKLGQEIRSGLELQRFADTMQDHQIDQLFDALSNGLGATVRQVVDFDWHYPALRALFSRKQVWRELVRRGPGLPLMG